MRGSRPRLSRRTAVKPLLVCSVALALAAPGYAAPRVRDASTARREVG